MPIRLALALALAAAPALAPLSALAPVPAWAADLDGSARLGPPWAGPPPRPMAPGCPPPGYVTRAPTNAPDDPPYVGSAFGLSRPSYYGTVPPPGVDDPYGRRIRLCP